MIYIYKLHTMALTIWDFWFLFLPYFSPYAQYLCNWFYCLSFKVSYAEQKFPKLVVFAPSAFFSTSKTVEMGFFIILYQRFVTDGSFKKLFNNEKIMRTQPVFKYC